MVTPGMEVEMVKLDLVKFATYNPRKRVRRGTKEYNDIAESMRRFGMVQNIVWNRRSGNLVGGHQRTYVGMEEFEWKEIPCKVVDLDDQEERALNLILNKVGEGNWDDTALQALLEEIKARGEIDIFTLGFSPLEIEKILGQKPKPTRRDPPSSYIHPTQKPTALVQRAARNSTMLGDTILDSFGGSGSTMIGAELAGRSSITIELDETFCDCIAQRMVETFEDVVVMKNETEVSPSSLIVTT